MNETLKRRKKCPHLNFEANVNVARLFDEQTREDIPPDRYSADVTIRCADCGEPFTFVGMPRGLSPTQPMMGFDGQEAHLPICPASENPNIGGEAFVIRGGLTRVKGN